MAETKAVEWADVGQVTLEIACDGTLGAGPLEFSRVSKLRVMGHGPLEFSRVWRTMRNALCLLPTIHAWAVSQSASVSIFDLDLQRWNTVKSKSDANAIRFAIAPDVCTHILDYFPEQTKLDGAIPSPSFLHCDYIHQTIQRAVKIWQYANQNLRFIDVTQRCSTWAHWGHNRNESTATPDIPLSCEGGQVPFGNRCLSCPHAQLAISMIPSANMTDGVLLRVEDSDPRVARRNYGAGYYESSGNAASDCSNPGTCTYLGGFPDTNQVSGKTIVAGSIALGDNSCYWLDADICLPMFKAQALASSTASIYTLLQSIVLIVFIGAVVLTVVQCLLDSQKWAQTMLLSWDTDGDGIVEFREIVSAIARFCRVLAQCSCRERLVSHDERSIEHTEIARATDKKTLKAFESRKVESRVMAYGVLKVLSTLNLPIWILLITGITYPMIVQSAVIDVCFSCHDFSALISQRVGIVLGLSSLRPSDPNASSIFMYGTSPYTEENRYDCSDPLRGVVRLDAAVPPGYSLMSQPTRVSNNLGEWALGNLTTLRCPTEDDAAGMRVLYPECDEFLACQQEVSGSPATSVSGCAIYTGNYSIGYADLYGNVTLGSDSGLLVNGSILPPPNCVGSLDLESTGLFRLLFLFVQATLVPVGCIVALYCLSNCILHSPLMRDTREEIKSLERTGEVRRAQVRRLTDHGKEYIAKRLAKQKASSDEVAASVLRSVKKRSSLSVENLVGENLDEVTLAAPSLKRVGATARGVFSNNRGTSKVSADFPFGGEVAVKS